MKPAFKSRHEDADVSDDTHVLIELGRYGLSILWFNKDPLTVQGVASYNFPGEATIEALQENVQTIINDNKLAAAAGVYVFYNFAESVLVPAEFHNIMDGAQQLNLIYGVTPQSVVAQDAMQFPDGVGNPDTVYNVYRIPVGISETVEKMTSAKPKHATSVQVKFPGTNVLQCTIYHNTIKVFLYSNNQLLIVQQFGYKTPADVVYHLLNTCDKYNLASTEVSLNLNGMIDSESSLYQEIYKYFLKVNFNTVSDDVNLSAEIQEHPSHFISHLTDLARCV